MKNKENGFINYIFKSACFGFDMHCAPLFCILITQEEEGQGYQACNMKSKPSPPPAQNTNRFWAGGGEGVWGGRFCFMFDFMLHA